MIDALQEGLVLHSRISTERFDVARVRTAVYRLIGPLGEEGLTELSWPRSVRYAIVDPLGRLVASRQGQ